MAWYEKQGKYGDVLQAIIRLVAWQYRWYSEVPILSHFSLSKRLEFPARSQSFANNYAK